MVLVFNHVSCLFMSYNISPCFFPTEKDTGINTYEENKFFSRISKLVHFSKTKLIQEKLLGLIFLYTHEIQLDYTHFEYSSSKNYPRMYILQAFEICVSFLLMQW